MTATIFVHVPKTGGTTLTHGYLKKVLPPDEIFVLSGRPGENTRDRRRLLAMSARQRRSLRVIAGHNTADLLDAIPEARGITVLRHPVRHALSQYLHARFHDPSSAAAGELIAAGVGLLEFSRRFQDPQLSAIRTSDAEDPEAALGRYTAVGTTEALELFIFSLHLRLGFPLLHFHNRLVRPEAKSFRLGETEASGIEAHHRRDVELYRLARRRFRQEVRALMGPAERRLWKAYRRELARFRRANGERPFHDVLFDQVGAARRHRSLPPPLVSVVTPCFNSGAFLEACIRSVAAQDYPRVEHVVQDGGSTDGSLEILARHADKVDWRSERDRGESHGLDRALKRSRGEVLVVLNSDDLLLPRAVSWAVEALGRHPEAAVIYGDQFLINERGEIIGVVFGPSPYRYEKLLCVEQVPPAQAAFIRRSHLHVVGLRADDGLQTCPDHEMWVRLGRRFPMHHVDGLVTKYRWHVNGKGRQGRVVDQMVADKRKVNARIFNDPAAPAQLRALRRRAEASLLLWGASMCIDADDTPRALYYACRGLLTQPSRPNLERLRSGLGHLKAARARRRWWRRA